MKNLQEQTKQKIILELERARLWSTFLLPLPVLFITIMFTKQYFGENAALRCIAGLAIFSLFFLLVLLRNECIRRAENYIKEL